jgi:hypothetical protein
VNVFVFTGPTLAPEEARLVLDAIYLPPVSQGDVYRVAVKRPQAIGIIDGYFERVPAVWHKEILWAMSQGIHVFGSASMGALRAAELAAFGMEGIGAVFEAYRDGALEDDDEVAVAHGAAETGYYATSEAMVNIRCTLAAAAAAGVLHPATRAALERIAKSLYYPERTYPLILSRAAGGVLPTVELDALRDWLPAGRINRKREDALAMLGLMRERLDAGLKPKHVVYCLQHTDIWDQTMRLAGELRLDPNAGAETIDLDMLLDELRLQEGAYLRVWQATLLRLLALREAARCRMVVTEEARRQTTATFRCEHGLLTPEGLRTWLEKHHLNQDEFAHLMKEQTQVRWAQEAARPVVLDHLPSHLRATGEYGGLMERARDKQRTLEACGLENPSLADVGLTEEELRRWYFEERLGRPVPVDIGSYAASLGFTDEDSFRLAVLHEYCYTQRRD